MRQNVCFYLFIYSFLSPFLIFLFFHKWKSYFNRSLQILLFVLCYAIFFLFDYHNKHFPIVSIINDSSEWRNLNFVCAEWRIFSIGEKRRIAGIGQTESGERDAEPRKNLSERSRLIRRRRSEVDVLLAVRPETAFIPSSHYFRAS